MGAIDEEGDAVRSEQDGIADRAIGARLAQARALSGRTALSIAAMVGSSRQVLYRHEKGTASIPCARLARLAAALGQPIGWFFADVLECLTPEAAVVSSSLGVQVTPALVEAMRLYSALPADGQALVMAQMKMISGTRG